MSRWVILDTETTGNDPRNGHRVIEVGCVELIERRRTGRTFQAYLNPDRDSDEGALQVHGLTREFLADKPRFPDIAEKYLVMFIGIGQQFIVVDFYDERDFVGILSGIERKHAKGGSHAIAACFHC